MMTYESLADGGFATGSMMGSGGFIVLDEDQCVVRHTLTLARFYRHESCGQCSPCREGTGWMEKILKNIEYGKGKLTDIDLLWDIQRRCTSSRCFSRRILCVKQYSKKWIIHPFRVP